MLSRLYILVSLATLAAVWLGGWGSLGHRERLVLSGVLLGGLTPLLWLDTMSRLGLRCLRSIPMMASIFLRSKRGSTLTGVTVFCLCFWLSPFAREPSPYRYHMSTTLVLAIALLWLQPPCVLVLGASNRQTGRALASVSRASIPFRVVALLDHRRTGYVVGAFSPLTDNLRTESDHHWRSTVDALADYVPLIVLDARTDTPIVVFEVKQIMERPWRRDRTIFVIGPDGQAPALEAHGVSTNAPDVRTIQEHEIELAVKEWLAASGRTKNQAQQQNPPDKG